VDTCKKPLPPSTAGLSTILAVTGMCSSASAGAVEQGLTLDHFTAQLEHVRDTLLTSETNLSTFGTHRSRWS